MFSSVTQIFFISRFISYFRDVRYDGFSSEKGIKAGGVSEGGKKVYIFKECLILYHASRKFCEYI
jgi:hypothetical protein